MTRPTTSRRYRAPRARRASVPTAGRGKKCGCVAPTSYEVMRLRQRVAYL